MNDHCKELHILSERTLVDMGESKHFDGLLPRCAGESQGAPAARMMNTDDQLNPMVIKPLTEVIRCDTSI